MYKAEEYYGKVIMNSCLPTQRAMKFLNYFLLAGWHKCNPKYFRSYENGISGSLLIFTVHGKGILQLKGNTYTLNSGSIALVPQDIPVSYYTHPKGEWEFYWVTMQGIYVRQVTSCILEEHGCVFNTGNMIDYINKVKQLIFMNDDNKFRFELEASQIISELLHDIIKDIYYITKDKYHSDNLSAKIANYLEQHYPEPVQLAKLSRMFHISKNQLIRIFQADTGYTPYEYLKMFRLLKACELLQMTNNSIEEIGRLTGFPSTSNFIFQFKKKYGMTPNNYRKLFSSSFK